MPHSTDRVQVREVLGCIGEDEPGVVGGANDGLHHPLRSAGPVLLAAMQG